MENPTGWFLGIKPTNMNRLYLLSVFPFLSTCYGNTDTTYPGQSSITLTIVSDITTPQGYKRTALAEDSFGNWLRSVPLKKDKRVYLYNGSPKRNQTAQFAVVDMTVGKKDLQQCADAIMRLRAEYFLSRGQLGMISFKATDGTILSFSAWRNGTRYRLSGNRLTTYRQAAGNTDTREDMETFLEFVFTYCGTYSLQTETSSIKINDMQPGDILIKGGSPGHAMIVMDMAVNDKGKKVFMLAQSYMPAQDIHIVMNPMEPGLSPWYEVNELENIITPEWEFSNDQLRRW